MGLALFAEGWFWGDSPTASGLLAGSEPDEAPMLSGSEEGIGDPWLQVLEHIVIERGGSIKMSENVLGLLIPVQLGHHRAHKPSHIMGFDVSNANGGSCTLDHRPDRKGGKRLAGGTDVPSIATPVKAGEQIRRIHRTGGSHCSMAA